MKIHILGTAAAEGWPGLFCGCPACRRARAGGGKDLRSRASVQIDEHYKIDFPPDSHYHSIRFGLSFSELKYLFFTHSHGDHFAVAELEYLREGFCHDLANPPVRIYAPESVYRAIEPLLRHRDIAIELHHARPFTPIQAGPLVFIPITASHAQGELCVNYVVQSGQSTLLYAADTGTYGRETLDFLRRFRFNALITECTFGPSAHVPRTHMTLSAVRELREHLAKSGALADDARWILTHFSHNMGLLHDELSAIVEPMGFEVAYDGLSFEC